MTTITIVNASKPAEFDVSNTVKHLNRTFAAKSKSMVRNSNELKSLQIEFCYLIDEIVRGYTYRRAKSIQNAYDFITTSFSNTASE